MDKQHNNQPRSAGSDPRQGSDEQRSKPYKKYDERAAQSLTQHRAESGGRVAGSAGKQAFAARGRGKPADTAVMANTQTRRGEVWRASKRNSDLVHAKATQHIIDVPVNKSKFNGRGGHQFTSGDIRRANRLPISQEKTLKVIPLGGVGDMRVGKNMMALEYEDDIIVIDMGFLFPGNDYPGINYMIPDTTYLEERKNKIRGIVFTHGHLDHIGGVRHILKKIPAPVYASKFTIGMIERQLSEDRSGYKPIMNIMNPERHDKVQLGKSFTVELIRVNHSIPDSTAVLIKSPVGNVLNSGDWRFEEHPVDGKKFDFDRLKQLANEGILLLMNESTGCETPGRHEWGEQEIVESLGKIMSSQNRIIISCFSTQIHRIQAILDTAKKHNRKVAFAGYSMIQNIEVALRSETIKIPSNVIMRMDEIIRLPDHQVVIVSTGSQGEMNSALTRMATGSHRQIKVKPTDTVVFSSNPIPGTGNEVNIFRTVDMLMREGSTVLENRNKAIDECGPLHLSGHAYRDEQAEFISMLKPKFYMPIHGDFRQLVRNAQIAKANGVPDSSIFVMDNGDVLELTANTASKTRRIKVGSVMYDQAGEEVSEVVLKDRIHMSTEGIFTVILTLNRSGQFLSSPDIISRGFIYLRDSEELMSKIRRYLKQKVMNAYQSGRTDIDNLKKAIREDVAHLLYDETERTPIVICVINEIGSADNGPRAKHLASRVEAQSAPSLNPQMQDARP